MEEIKSSVPVSEVVSPIKVRKHFNDKLLLGLLLGFALSILFIFLVLGGYYFIQSKNTSVVNEAPSNQQALVTPAISSTPIPCTDYSKDLDKYSDKWNLIIDADKNKILCANEHPKPWFVATNYYGETKILDQNNVEIVSFLTDKKNRQTYNEDGATFSNNIVKSNNLFFIPLKNNYIAQWNTDSYEFKLIKSPVNGSSMEYFNNYIYITERNDNACDTKLCSVYEIDPTNQNSRVIFSKVSKQHGLATALTFTYADSKSFWIHQGAGDACFSQQVFTQFDITNSKFLKKIIQTTDCDNKQTIAIQTTSDAKDYFSVNLDDSKVTVLYTHFLCWSDNYGNEKNDKNTIPCETTDPAQKSIIAEKEQTLIEKLNENVPYIKSENLEIKQSQQVACSNFSFDRDKTKTVPIPQNKYNSYYVTYKSNYISVLYNESNKSDMVNTAYCIN